MKKVFFAALFLTVLSFQNCSMDGFKAMDGLRSKPVSYGPSTLSVALFSASNVLQNRLPAQVDLESLRNIRNYEATLRAYMETPQFRQVMFEEHKNYLEVGGTRIGSAIDYDLPARIGAYLISSNQGYDNILKTIYCVDSNYNVVSNCSDTFPDDNAAAQYGAGVITTQSFISLYKNTARYNFGLVARVSRAFLCSHYPDGTDPGMTQEEISNDIHPFGEDRTCYACHRTLNPRAAMFYNFDGAGKFVFQTDTGSTVRETLEASKVQDLIKAPARTLKRQVANIRQYGDAITKDPRFAECMTVRYFNFMTGHKLSHLPDSFKYLAVRFEKSNYSVKELLIDIAKSPYFIDRLPLR